jgi:hypothetical protein
MIVITNAVELSLGGSTDKTNNNKIHKRNNTKKKSSTKITKRSKHTYTYVLRVFESNWMYSILFS